MQDKHLLVRARHCLLFFAAFTLASNSFAHQQKEAYITLLFSKNTGKLEVAHRFLLHDAEHIFSQLFDLKQLGFSADLLNDTQSQAAFASYVETHFELASSTLENLPLSSVGYEVEGKYLWVYQETPIPNGIELNIRHSALHELWPDQINHINVERDGKVRSIRLRKADANRWHLIRFDEP